MSGLTLVKKAWTTPDPSKDPTVLRAIRRARALRAVGWTGRTGGLCEPCSKILWNRAGEENLDGPFDGVSPDVLRAAAAEIQTAAILIGKAARGEKLAAEELGRIRLAAGRLAAAQSLLQ